MNAAYARLALHTALGLDAAQVAERERSRALRSVECPWCLARRRQPCVIPGSATALTGVHPSRAEAAAPATTGVAA